MVDDLFAISNGRWWTLGSQRARGRQVFGSCIALVISWVLTGVGCSGETGSTDDCFPTTIVDLASRAAHATGICLTWTAPEANDEAVHRYLVRYSPDSSQVNGVPPLEQRLLSDPREPSQPESLEVLGLSPDTQYYFTLQSVSIDGCLSEISQIMYARTRAGIDSLPPAAPEVVEALASTATSVTLRWSQSGDDGQWSVASTYEIGVADSPIDASTWGDVTKHTVSAESTAGILQEYSVGNLHWSRQYFFAIRAYDERENASDLSMLAIKATTARTLIVGDGGTEYTKIQQAVDAADPLDTVLVAPGVYNESIQISDKGIVLVSRDGPFATTIDAAGLSRPVMALENVHPEIIVVKGFTLQSGQAINIPNPSANPQGGAVSLRRGVARICDNVIQDNTSNGILASQGGAVSAGSPVPDPDSARIEICHNIFLRNYANSNGGAIAIIGPTHAVIGGNRFEDNRAEYDGGAIWIWTRTGTCIVTGNVFRSNYAGDHGGALYVANRTEALTTTADIINNAFVENISDGRGFGDTASGGGVWGSGLSGLIENNTFAYNIGRGETVESGGGLAVLRPSSGLKVRRNIFVGNIGSGFVCRRDPVAEVGANMFWMNDPAQLGNDGYCPLAWRDQAIESDPELCSLSDFVPMPGGRAHQLGMGAFVGDGCGSFELDSNRGHRDQEAHAWRLDLNAPARRK